MAVGIAHGVAERKGNEGGELPPTPGQTRTVVSGFDLNRGVAFITIYQTTTHYRTVPTTVYKTETYEIRRRVVTDIVRTYTLRFGDIFTSVVQTIPTRYVTFETTVKIGESTATQQARRETPATQPARPNLPQ